MSFTIEHMEYCLMVIARVSAFVMAAPFFNYNSIPARMKAAISIMLSLLVIQIHPPAAISYAGMIGYSILVVKEIIVGLILGFMCNLCMHIVNFAGQLMDMQMGLSMANMFDPATNVQITVTGNIYNYLIMLLLVVTNMHYYIIRAVFDSFTYFGVGEAVFRGSLSEMMIDFMANYFIIAFRIVLPVFCCMLVVDIILGVLSRAAPQMNMFVVGIQIKVLVGIIVLLVLVQTLPMVSDFIFSEMKNVMSQVIRNFTP